MAPVCPELLGAWDLPCKSGGLGLSWKGSGKPALPSSPAAEGAAQELAARRSWEDAVSGLCSSLHPRPAPTSPTHLLKGLCQSEASLGARVMLLGDNWATDLGYLKEREGGREGVTACLFRSR